jgi:hypothetical protein
MTCDYESWRLEVLMLARTWHRLDTREISEARLRQAFERDYAAWEAAKWFSEFVSSKRAAERQNNTRTASGVLSGGTL